ncbi:hypothetical protein BOTBODRAFT_67821 [Botryobasidium botryosum FD-172 SS1]|uniref:Uncharacterized protein n=1 Tax=Botryobasidium botryosum (strain FD-172 SS1) TaxID=930990 RepID=A0A067MIZ9_BOTB1|nr:hypothetical protein BOTBODRAFT_67821 [Botryobasidium botryosum FD-172 SS1]
MDSQSIWQRFNLSTFSVVLRAPGFGRRVIDLSYHIPPWRAYSRRTGSQSAVLTSINRKPTSALQKTWSSRAHSSSLLPSLTLSTQCPALNQPFALHALLHFHTDRDLSALFRRSGLVISPLSFRHRDLHVSALMLFPYASPALFVSAVRIDCCSKHLGYPSKRPAINGLQTHYSTSDIRNYDPVTRLQSSPASSWLTSSIHEDIMTFHAPLPFLVPFLPANFP